MTMEPVPQNIPHVDAFQDTQRQLSSGDVTGYNAVIDAMKSVRDSKGIAFDNGKTYSMVVDRVEQFRRHFGDRYGIETQIIQYGTDEGQPIVVKATITRLIDRVIVAQGHAEELRNKNHLINSVSALENAETSAIGRALSSLGINGGEFASGNELQGAARKKETKSLDAMAAWFGNAIAKKEGASVMLDRKGTHVSELDGKLAGKEVTMIVTDEVEEARAEAIAMVADATDAFQECRIEGKQTVLSDQIGKNGVPSCYEVVDTKDIVAESGPRVVTQDELEDIISTENASGDMKTEEAVIAPPPSVAPSGGRVASAMEEIVKLDSAGTTITKAEADKIIPVRPRTRPAFLGAPSVNRVSFDAKATVMVTNEEAAEKVAEGHPIFIPNTKDQAFFHAAAAVLDKAISGAADVATIDTIHKANAGLWLAWKSHNAGEHQLFTEFLKTSREKLTSKGKTPIDADGIPF